MKQAKKAALEVLLHNAHGSYHGLPRTAGWGYPEPYTRDLMFSIFGIAVSENKKLTESIRRVLVTLAKNQTKHGHIPSLVHDPEDRGSSDTTPLFLLGVGIFRKLSGESDFLNDAVEKALIWMEYQSPSDRYLVAQQPTSDWRDEQWVTGYGLFVNTLVYCCLRLLGRHERADLMIGELSRFTVNRRNHAPSCPRRACCKDISLIMLSGLIKFIAVKGSTCLATVLPFSPELHHRRGLMILFPGLKRSVQE